MELLDPRSIVFVASITNGLMALLLYLIRLNYPPHIGGLGYWALASASWCVGAILITFRGTEVPVFLTDVASDIFIFSGILLYYAGCRAFLGQSTQWWPWLVLIAIIFIVDVITAYTQKGGDIILLVFTTSVILLYINIFIVLLKHGDKNLPVRLIQAVLLVHAWFVAWRIISIPGSYVAQDIFQQTWTQVTYLGSFVIALFFFTLGALLIATDRLVRELEHLAQKDPLTQLSNRRTLFECMENELARTKRTGSGMVLLIFDLDHFKNINDTKGHQHGDKVLLHFANTLRTQLRQTDCTGRYGGEEFMALLPETDQATALQISQRIHDATNNGHEACQVSIGLTNWQGTEDSMEAMISRADTAVYEAKAQGRNRTCVA
jgi:diguanylate cyclase (GGDEF)-like protein